MLLILPKVSVLPHARKEIKPIELVYGNRFNFNLPALITIERTKLSDELIRDNKS